jgi:hypothetical protein
VRALATGSTVAVVRLMAAWELGEAWSPDPRALAVLHDMAVADDDVDVRRSLSAVAGGWPGDPGTLRLLRDRATAGGSPGVRQEAERLATETIRRNPA